MDIRDSSNKCAFADILPTCCLGDKTFSSKLLSDHQLTKIISCSKQRQDGFKEKAATSVKTYHTSCYASYTSAAKIEKHISSVKKRKSVQQHPSSSTACSTKRLRSSIEQPFNFGRDCFICGHECQVKPDPKNPNRWKKNPVILCKTADRGQDNFGKDRKTFKEVLLEACTKRCDFLADAVRIRLEGAVSDLHAVDAKYHKKCYLDFVNVRNIKAVQNHFNLNNPDEEPFNYVLQSIRSESEKVWSSVELMDAYLIRGGTEKNRSRFVARIKDHLKDEIYCFKAQGVATVLMHKQMASNILKVVENNEEDESVDILKVAQRIKSDIKDFPGVTDKYPVLDEDEISNICLPTLTDILVAISSTFRNNLKGIALISSMVAAISSSQTSILQVALGLFVHDKKVIQQLHEYGVTCSYDEVRRFKISAANFTTNQKPHCLKSEHGLIHGVSDNFDANLCTQNGLKQTHSLATILVQHTQTPCNTSREPIPRLKKPDLGNVSLTDVTLKTFTGEKKPNMPETFARHNVLPLKVLCNQQITVRRSRHCDFQFMKDILTNPDTPDYGGYNTKQARKSGQIVKPKSRIIYKPLINKTPSDHSTILSAMCDVESESLEAGQEVTIFTCDQQLYRITIDVIWNDLSRWKNFYPRIGGMHWLMSFSGSIGKLMKNSGLDMWMGSAFAGVDKMLLGKKFPMNIRAFRICAIELLRSVIEPSTTCDELDSKLHDLSALSCLPEHWIKNFIHPVFLILLYIRAEREGEFGLHLYVCQKMLPYFFASGHWNYARDAIVYLRSMESLPKTIFDKFMNGEHVVRLQDGLFNGIWSDMAIESTYMKTGKGPSGIIGVTNNERSVSIWANGHHLCNQLLTELFHLEEGQRSFCVKHKEEGVGRIVSDDEDRKKIKSALQKCIHPLEIEQHSENKLVNIYSGEVSEDFVNVNKAVEIGNSLLTAFKESLPNGFRKPLSSKVVSMTSSRDKRRKSSCKKDEFNTELLFSRVVYLLGTHQIDFEEIFYYELSPVPTSLFYDSGAARYPKAKSVLMNKLKVEETSCNVQPNAVVIDGGGMLYSCIYWPSNGRVEDLVTGVEQYLRRQALNSDVYLIFDRYYEGSVKSDTRSVRVGEFRRAHQLSLSRELPPKDMCLSSVKTKENLIEIISNELLLRFTENAAVNKVVITNKNATPEEVSSEGRVKRLDLISYYDEADYIIPQQVNSAVAGGALVVKVKSADTDVFVLLCEMFLKKEWSPAQVYMENFSKDEKIINIQRTVEKNVDIVPFLIPLHAISGCDSVPMLYGIGKGKALNTVKNTPLIHLGDSSASLSDVIEEGKRFIAKCYAQTSVSSSTNRQSIWMAKTQRSKVSAKPPALKSLPPTDEALELNIKRSHYAAVMWRHCVSGQPPQMDPCSFGWELEEDGVKLRPRMLPNDVKIAPDDVLKMVRCSCAVIQCKNNQCSCFKANMKCTKFCGCEVSLCENQISDILQLTDSESDDENATVN